MISNAITHEMCLLSKVSVRDDSQDISGGLRGMWVVEERCLYWKSAFNLDVSFFVAEANQYWQSFFSLAEDDVMEEACLYCMSTFEFCGVGFMEEASFS